MQLLRKQLRVRRSFFQPTQQRRWLFWRSHENISIWMMLFECSEIKPLHHTLGVPSGSQRKESPVWLQKRKELSVRRVYIMTNAVWWRFPSSLPISPKTLFLIKISVLAEVKVAFLLATEKCDVFFRERRHNQSVVWGVVLFCYHCSVCADVRCITFHSSHQQCFTVTSTQRGSSWSASNSARSVSFTSTRQACGLHAAPDNLLPTGRVKCDWFPSAPCSFHDKFIYEQSAAGRSSTRGVALRFSLQSGIRFIPRPLLPVKTALLAFR